MHGYLERGRGGVQCLLVQQLLFSTSSLKLVCKNKNKHANSESSDENQAFSASTIKLSIFKMNNEYI